MLHKAYVRDSHNRIIGSVTSGFANGDSVIRDSDGSILRRSNGHYNTTRDASGNIKLNSPVPGYLLR
jgi:hypothetical protein